MGKLRNIFSYGFLPLLFLWYISGITLFSHTHIVDGVSIVHSHPNTDAEHQGESEYLTIHVLAQFQSCEAGEGVALPELFRLLIAVLDDPCELSPVLEASHSYFSLRAPPVA